MSKNKQLKEKSFITYRGSLLSIDFSFYMNNCIINEDNVKFNFYFIWYLWIN